MRSRTSYIDRRRLAMPENPEMPVTSTVDAQSRTALLALVTSTASQASSGNEKTFSTLTSWSWRQCTTRTVCTMSSRSRSQTRYA
jgi:hypothetical protein